MSKRPLFSNTWHFIAAPSVAWLIHAIALWGWHYPALFQATLNSDAIHAMQHFSFLGSALLFWWALLENMGYRQLTVYWRLRGLWKFIRGRKDWGAMERKGFQAVPTAVKSPDAAA